MLRTAVISSATTSSSSRGSQSLFQYLASASGNGCWEVIHSAVPG